MSWASERRLSVFLVLGAVALAIAAVFYLALFYQAPSCTDHVKDGNETGVDCGGSCPYLCTAQEEPPTVLFTQAIPNGAGRTDIIAEIENKNQAAAAKAIPYSVILYGYDQSLIQTISGTVDLPPGATVPVFIPGVASGQATVGTAFLRIDPTTVEWYALPSDPRLLPQVTGTALSGASTTPRISATLTNPDVEPMMDIKAIVIVKDANGNAIAASQTIVPSIPAQGSAMATFTWDAPLKGMPVVIEVLPAVPLP